MAGRATEGAVAHPRPQRALAALLALGVLLGCVRPGAGTGSPEAGELAALRARAERLHRSAIVVDGHNDVAVWCLDYGFDLGMDGADPAKRPAAMYWVLGGLLPRPSGSDLRTNTDLRRLRAGGVNAQFFSAFVHDRYVPRGPHEAGRARGRALDLIAVVREQVRRHSDQLELAGSVADVRRIVGQGRIAALLGVEGGHAIEDDLGTLRTFYDLGVRYLTLTWNNTNDWADAAGDGARHGGLSPFGRDVVRTMNDLGMLVDVSHASDETFFDVIETSRTPVIASHSGARAVANHPRNLSDAQLQALARNGGVAMVNFADTFVDPAKTTVVGRAAHWLRTMGSSGTPLSLVVDHIDHIVRVAGIDHVGLGSDFDGTLFYPDGLEDVSGFPNITLELLRRGYSEDATRKVLGENLLRALEAVESAALPSSASDHHARGLPGAPG